MISRSSIGMAVTLFVLLISCRKFDDKYVEPLPPDVSDSTAYIQFAITGIQNEAGNKFGLLSVETKTGQPVFTNRKVAVSKTENSFKTEKLKIPKGEYKLTKFLVTDAEDTARYASPKAQSAKAPAVTTPLAINFTITQKGIKAADIQVLKIADTDNAEDYGYTVEDFGKFTYLTLKVWAKVKVGTVSYDSLPAKLTIDATDAAGSHWIREVELKKGMNDVNVPDNYTSFNFIVHKWNALSQKTFTRQEINAGQVIGFEATRQMKKIAKEEVYIENSAGLLADSRTEYYYNTKGLSEVKNYQRSLQVSGLHLTNLYTFVYNGNQLDTIKRSSPQNPFTGYTAFTYAGDKIISMRNLSYDQETTAAVEYTGEDNNMQVDADYLFGNGQSMFYRMQFKNGNRMSDQAQSSTGGTENGVYTYDDHVNPLHQINFPDIYFLNASKNNKLSENKTYGGAFPTVIPYKFEYLYNEDGYPTEAYISYKGYSSGQHLYRIKKVYTYHP